MVLKKIISVAYQPLHRRYGFCHQFECRIQDRWCCARCGKGNSCQDKCMGSIMENYLSFSVCLSQVSFKLQRGFFSERLRHRELTSADSLSKCPQELQLTQCASQGPDTQSEFPLSVIGIQLLEISSPLPETREQQFRVLELEWNPATLRQNAKY